MGHPHPIFITLPPSRHKVLTREDDESECIKRHKEGTVFAAWQRAIPTFDVFDREFDSAAKTVVYRENAEVIIIDCHYGYRIPAIKIYRGVKAGIPALEHYLAAIEECEKTKS